MNELSGIERRTTMVGGYRVHSVHAGSGPSIVLLHGLSGSGRWWRYTIPMLAERFCTHVPDLVGFGRSRGYPQPSIADMAQIVVDWMRANGIEQAHVLGHSMGGQIAIHIAAEHSAAVSKLILVAAAGIPRRLSIGQAARFIAEIVPPRAWGSPRFFPTVAIDALRSGPRVLLSAIAHLLRDDVRPLLPLITAPTLVIWGALDPLTPLHDGQYMADHISDARLRVFEDAAHMPMVDVPDRFNSAVHSFFSE